MPQPGHPKRGGWQHLPHPVPEPPRDASQEARPSCPALTKLSELSLEIVTLTASGGAFIYF